MSEYFEVYAMGLCYASVCTDLPIEEATKRLNQAEPTGIKSRWSLAGEDFRTGEPNPHPCEKDPSRKHYLFSC